MTDKTFHISIDTTCRKCGGEFDLSERFHEMPAAQKIQCKKCGYEAQLSRFQMELEEKTERAAMDYVDGTMKDAFKDF